MGFMAKNETLDGNRFCKFKSITFHAGFLESEAWQVLTKSQINVFIYIWSCLQWADIGKRRKRDWVTINNGDIEISMEKMRDKLDIVKATSTEAIRKLITVGLIRLTREGQNKVCHKYKMLYQVVPTNEQRWKKYPDQDWAHECPKSPNNLVGKKTQFKSHPNKVDRIADNQTNKVDRSNANGLKKYTENGVFEE